MLRSAIRMLIKISKYKVRLNLKINFYQNVSLDFVTGWEIIVVDVMRGHITNELR